MKKNISSWEYAFVSSHECTDHQYEFAGYSPVDAWLHELEQYFNCAWGMTS